MPKWNERKFNLDTNNVIANQELRTQQQQLNTKLLVAMLESAIERLKPEGDASLLGNPANKQQQQKQHRQTSFVCGCVRAYGCKVLRC